MAASLPPTVGSTGYLSLATQGHAPEELPDMAGPRGCRLCDKADNRRGIVSPQSHQNANNRLNLLKGVFGVPLAFL